ncbi:hypothetical protein JOQ06_022059 [Pogonophryne albipinna]|uniref:SET domain-containing protein n=1 Tax=Pogonophryne albipinna TaxID=1090488 RepID=A0AAD6F2L9_9TELE|nr:hypothetical protein JOQ06_022059 [Pogonophryne albipinna]
MSNHKTSESFGTAKMLLSSGEYGWLLSLMKIKRDAGRKSTFVFFNTTLKTTEKLTTYLQNAWEDMKLRGVPTFISLRSAVATFARDRHGEDSQARKSMARLMCHDTLTADKHYAMDLNVQQAREGRLLFEQAQETTKSRTRPQSEEEEEEEGDKGEEKGDEEQESGTSSRMKKSTPRMTRSQSGKVKCRVLLSPLKISPRKRSHRSRFGISGHPPICTYPASNGILPESLGPQGAELGQRFGISGHPPICTYPASNGILPESLGPQGAELGQRVRFGKYDFTSESVGTPPICTYPASNGILPESLGPQGAELGQRFGISGHPPICTYPASNGILPESLGPQGAELGQRLRTKWANIKSRLVSGQRVPGSDLTAYRSYCVAALLIRHKLPKEAVVEFQVHDWLQRTTGTDGTTIRLTSSKAAGHTFTLSQQEDELLECYFCHVRAEATKRLTSEQGRFFVDCGGNPLTNLYADLQRLRKKYLPQVPGAAVDETPSSSETPSTSTGPASLPTPPVSLGKQWDRFLEVFPVSLRSAPPRKRQCVGAGFTAHRPLYRKWRNVQLLERTSYILSQAMGRQEATQPTEEAVRRALTKEGWVTNTPSVQDVVRGWVAPRDPPTCSRRLIRSISEQSWRGLAVRDFGGGEGQRCSRHMSHGQRGCREFCIDASSRCDCHPEVDTYGRFRNHSRKRPNLKAKRFDLTFPDGPRPVLVFLAMHNIKVGEELLWDYGVTKTSFGGEGKDLAWLDM